MKKAQGDWRPGNLALCGEARLRVLLVQCLGVTSPTGEDAYVVAGLGSGQSRLTVRGNLALRRKARQRLLLLVVNRQHILPRPQQPLVNQRLRQREERGQTATRQTAQYVLPPRRRHSLCQQQTCNATCSQALQTALRRLERLNLMTAASAGRFGCRNTGEAPSC